MNIKYLYKNITISDKERDYIEKRLIPLTKLNGKILKTEVEIERDKKRKIRVEVMLTVPKGLFRADDVTDSVEESIDLVAEELRTQMTRQKEKIWTRIMRGARSVKKMMSIDRDARF